MYEVLLPHTARYLPEADIFVRAHSSVSDPLEVLVAEGQETPFFHDRRFELVTEFAKQRVACAGITALLAAKIDYYSHQVAVVRRILEDPIQRYFLADEVGLGKTIESGLVLKQLLLDNPRTTALVLAPRPLVEQWREELEDRLGIAVGVDNRVFLEALEDAPERQGPTRVDLLIVDEAQHAVTGAFATDFQAQRLYRSVSHLALNARQLLLLSATPLLHHEQDFLAMLHLLDPLRYDLADLAGFRRKLEIRQRIGRHLLQLHDGVDPYLAEIATKQIREEFPDDAELASLCDGLLKLLQEIEPSMQAVVGGVRAIRVHLSENYRLHRRLIRHRRIGDTEATLLPRIGNAASGNQVGTIFEYDIDERSEQLEVLLEAWRQKALASQADRSTLAAIFTTLIECASTELGALGKWTRIRRRGRPDKWLPLFLGGQRAVAIGSLPLFDGEEELLERMEKLIAKPSSEGDRVNLVTEIVAEIVRKNAGKVVVFSGYTPAAKEVLRSLRERLSDSTVACHIVDMEVDDITLSVESFRDDPKCRVLVCDSSAEEGRNFQHASTIVLFDVPWAPNRIEQRLGRIDRIGRNAPMVTKVLAGYEGDDCGLAGSWCQLLANGFGIFNRSVASLQFFIEKEMPTIARIALESGAAGLRDRVHATQEGIHDELLHIAEYDLLDTIDAVDQGGHELTATLEKAEHDVDRTIKAVEQWAVDALRIERGPANSERRVITYNVTESCLLPNEVRRHLMPLARRASTYYRSVACAKPDLALLRLGDEFLDALQTNLEWDDRGQAYAIWRCEPKWAGTKREWTGFRFDYRVEVDTGHLVQSSELNGRGSDQMLLRRRGDGVLSPFIHTVWVDLAGNEISDQDLLAILERKFRKVRDGGSDVGMHSENSKLLYRWVDPSRWSEVCAEARSVSERHLRNSPSFLEACRNAALSADRKTQARLQQLRLRVAYERRSTSAIALERAVIDLSVEEALGRALADGVRKPKITLDAVGFIVITAQNPPVANDARS